MATKKAEELGRVIDMAFSERWPSKMHKATATDCLQDAAKLKDWLLLPKHNENSMHPFTMNESILERIQEPDALLAELSDRLRSTQQGKPDAVRRVMQFLSYLNWKYDAELDVSGFSYFKWENENERLLTMLKYVHDKTHSRQEIADALGVTLRTVNDDISKLKKGFQFMGTEIKIDDTKKGDFGSLVHPIFLALNTSEIFILTVGLSMLAENTVFESKVFSLAGQIMNQLGPTTKDLMHQQAAQYEIQVHERQLQFFNTSKFVLASREEEAPFSYFLREPIPCEVHFRVDDKVRMARGVMTIADAHPGGFRKIAITEGDVKTVIDMEAVKAIYKAADESHANSSIANELS